MLGLPSLSASSSATSAANFSGRNGEATFGNVAFGSNAAALTGSPSTVGGRSSLLPLLLLAGVAFFFLRK